MASTHNSLLIFLWSQETFISIKQVNVDSPMYDFVLSTTNQYVRGPVVYAVHTNGTCTAYNFGNPQNGAKAIQMKPLKRNKKLYEMGAYMSVPKEQTLTPYDPKTAERLTPDQRRKLKKEPTRWAPYYKEYGIKQIGIQEGGLGRIQALENERTIYCGSQSLRVLENKNGDYVLLNKPNPVKPFVDLLLLKNTGELIVFEKNTSDLVKYDVSMVELKRLKGVQPIDSRWADYVTTIYAGSEQRYLWIKGDNSMGVVDSSSFNLEVIPNFFGKAGDKSTPITAIASKPFDKFIGLYNTDSSQMIVFLDRKVGLIRKRVSDLNPRIPVLYSAENCHIENGIFLTGGSTSIDLQRGSAVLQAITFDTSLEMIDELELKSSNNVPRGAVVTLTRATDRDVFFAGVNQAVFVVEWTGTHLCILNYVDEVHTSLPISVSATTPIRLHTSCPSDSHVNRVDFRPS